MILQRQRIYLDYNATAPLCAEAQKATINALQTIGNPSSVHYEGRAARHHLEVARETIATAIAARSEDLIFTSGGTEANALALKAQDYRHLIVSAIEHDSILRHAEAMKIPVDLIPVNRSGVIDLQVLKELLAAKIEKTLVVVMLANNETGVIQPIAAAAKLAQEFGAFFHCDAVQALGKLSFDIKELGVDSLSLSAHKLGGPLGVGALAIRPHLSVSPLIYGGGQENRRRSGTPNLPGIMGMAATISSLPQRLADQLRQADLRDRLEHTIRSQANDAIIYGGEVPRLSNTSCIGMPHMTAETQVIIFDMGGFAVSAGSACSSGKITTSHVLHAMGASGDEARCAIRVSLGPETSLEELDQFSAAWCNLYHRAKARSAA